ncbi:MAG: heparin lyase I family protein [Austwickia sp.]|nr:heparin lyase I family protein [Austwickia sp.]
MYSAFKVHAWDGDRPVNTGSSWFFRLPPMSTPPQNRRSELWWAKDGRELQFSEGHLVSYSADVAASLGPAASRPDDWHVLWQLISTTDGEWKGRAVTLDVSGGRLRLTGGTGNPAHDPNTGQNYHWVRDLAPFTNDRTYRIRLEVFLSRDPEYGWVSAWVDGQQVVEHWRPSSGQGYRAGTFFEGSAPLNIRSGLYRGTEGHGPRPTTEQWARHSNIDITARRPVAAE